MTANVLTTPQRSSQLLAVVQHLCRLLSCGVHAPLSWGSTVHPVLWVQITVFFSTVSLKERNSHRRAWAAARGMALNGPLTSQARAPFRLPPDIFTASPFKHGYVLVPLSPSSVCQGSFIFYCLCLFISFQTQVGLRPSPRSSLPVCISPSSLVPSKGTCFPLFTRALCGSSTLIIVEKKANKQTNQPLKTLLFWETLEDFSLLLFFLLISF